MAATTQPIHFNTRFEFIGTLQNNIYIDITLIVFYFWFTTKKIHHMKCIHIYSNKYFNIDNIAISPCLKYTLFVFCKIPYRLREGP